MGLCCCIINSHNRPHDQTGKQIPNGVHFFNFPVWKQHNGAQEVELTKRHWMALVAAVRQSNITFTNISQSMYVFSQHFTQGSQPFI
ncbi:hypothetical protein AMECASPLE_038813 [Ameca splendens]|uniref:THAP-type domain-containing protein n=1 Tax=Ameca splendens TaxID=208324 RepID=A0ABV0XLD1_9TELE